jgi:hypothetical protein
MRAPLLAALALPLCLLLGACGGGGASTESTQASTATAPSSDASTPAQLAATRRRAAAAAPFVEAKADNSIPTYGREAGGAERSRARVSLAAYLRARQKEDWAGACRGLSASTRAGFRKLSKGKATCPSLIAALSKGVDLTDPLKGPLLSLRVQGIHGFALFYGPAGEKYVMPVRGEEGTWKATELSAIAYPPIGRKPPR